PAWVRDYPLLRAVIGDRQPFPCWGNKEEPCYQWFSASSALPPPGDWRGWPRRKAVIDRRPFAALTPPKGGYPSFFAALADLGRSAFRWAAETAGVAREPEQAACRQPYVVYDFDLPSLCVQQWTTFDYLYEAFRYYWKRPERRTSPTPCSSCPACWVSDWSVGESPTCPVCGWGPATAIQAGSGPMVGAA